MLQEAATYAKFCLNTVKTTDFSDSALVLNLINALSITFAFETAKKSEKNEKSDTGVFYTSMFF